MPCWFFEKRDLKHTPSDRDGVDPDTETRYRREGARFILDTGSKMGLYPFVDGILKWNNFVALVKGWSDKRSVVPVSIN